MPLSDLHKKKRAKNFIVLALIIAFMALVWTITMVRMANAQDLPQLGAQVDVQTLPDVGEEQADEMPQTLSSDLVRSRTSGIHAGASSDDDDSGSVQPIRSVSTDTALHAKDVIDCKNPFANTRSAHQDDIIVRQDGWVDKYHAEAGARAEKERQRDENRATHQVSVLERQQGWIDKYNTEADARAEEDRLRDEARLAHYTNVSARPQDWWDKYYRTRCGEAADAQ